MADMLGLSNNARKRHKPIEPPSPDHQRRHHLLNSTTASTTEPHQQYYSHHHRHSNPQQQQRLPPRLSPSPQHHGLSSSGGHHSHSHSHHHYQHQERLSNDEDINNEDSLSRSRAKASVFERLGGNVVSPPKRTCLNWINTRTCPRGLQCMYLHPPLSPDKVLSVPPSLPPSIHHQSQQHQHSSSYRHQHHPVDQQQQSPMGHHHGHYQQQQQQQRHHYYSNQQNIDHNLLERSPNILNSRLRSSEPRSEHGRSSNKDHQRRTGDDRGGGGVGHLRGGERYEYSRTNGDGNHHEHRRQPQQHSSRRSTSSRDRNYATSGGGNMLEDLELSDHENAKLKSAAILVTKSKTSESVVTRAANIPPDEDDGGESRELERIAESVLLEKCERIKREIQELDAKKQGDNPPTIGDGNRGKVTEKQLPTTESSTNQRSSKNGVVNNKSHHSRLPYPASPSSTATNSTTARHRYSSSAKLGTVKQEQSHSQSRYHHRREEHRRPYSNLSSTSSAANSHRYSSTQKISGSSSNRLHHTSEHRRRDDQPSRSNDNLGRNSHSTSDRNRKRPSSSLGSERRHGGGDRTSSRSMKKGKYEDEEIDNKRKGRSDIEAGGKQSSSSNSRNEESKKVKMNKEGLETVRLPTDRATLDNRELEPISDEEVEEASGESSSIAALGGTMLDSNRKQDDEASTSTYVAENKKMVDALNVEWSEVTRDSKMMMEKSSTNVRRRCFDLNHFLPTIGICVDYVKEEIWTEACTTGADGEKGRLIEMNAVTKNYTTMKRRRLMNDVGSSFRRAMSARIDLNMRRQLCGLVAEADITNTNSMELNSPLNGRTFGKAFSIFEKWTKN